MLALQQRVHALEQVRVAGHHLLVVDPVQLQARIQADLQHLAGLGKNAAEPARTYRQALELGAHVQQGERGTTVVYADRIIRNEVDDAGNDVEKAIPLLKAYTVFNVQQIEGLPPQYLPVPEGERPKVELIASAEAFIGATGAVIRHGGDSAYYSRSLDIIQI